LRRHYRITPVLLLLAVLVGACGTVQAPASPAPVSGQPSGPAPTIVIASGATGGAFNVIGTAIAQVVSQNTDKVKVSSEPSTGTTENTRLVQNKRVDVGMQLAPGLHWATNKMHEFKDEDHKNLRIVMFLNAGVMQIAVKKDSPYKSLADLADKKLACTPGVCANILAEMMNYWGVKYTPEVMPVAATADALKDGLVAALPGAYSVPVVLFTELASTVGIRLIPLESAKLQGFVTQFPYYGISSIPAGTYPGQDTAVPAFSTANVLFARDDTNEEAIYHLVKTVMENTEKIKAIHPAGQDMGIDNPFYKTPPFLPYHKGTERYLKEKGVLK